MKKTRLLILLMGLIAIAVFIYNLAGTDAVPVKLVKPEIRNIETSIRVTGHVINDKTVTMTALVNGQIEGMLVQKGERVEADQILAFFDSVTFGTE